MDTNEKDLIMACVCMCTKPLISKTFGHVWSRSSCTSASFVKRCRCFIFLPIGALSVGESLSVSKLFSASRKTVGCCEGVHASHSGEMGFSRRIPTLASPVKDQCETAETLFALVHFS